MTASSATGHLLELDEISKSYPVQSDLRAPPVLKNCSLQVEAGESLAIVGPSGCGKSTLLNIIGGIDQPDSGSVMLDSEDIVGLPDAELAELRNRRFGFIFQEHHLLPQCSVLENVLLPTLAARRRIASPAQARERAYQLLETVCLDDRTSAHPGELSGGERQRVAAVRALINQPRILLADEPTGALDRTTAESLARLLLRLQTDENITLIMVTHATWLADQVGRKLELRDGKLA